MPMPAHAYSNPNGERRQTPRYRPEINLSASLGRHDAIVSDLSIAGARIYHFTAVRRDDMVRFTMRFGECIFSSMARVLASSVQALASGPTGSVTYKSRLQFVNVDPREQATLHALLIHLQERRDRAATTAASSSSS